MSAPVFVRHDWMADAECAKPDVDSERFFPVGPGRSDHDKIRMEQAKVVCRRCPAVAACLRYGLDYTSDDSGVLGGMTPTERRKERRRRALAPMTRRAA